VLNAVPAKGDRHDQARDYLLEHQMPVCPFMLGTRVVFGDAALVGQAAQEYDARDKGASEILQVYKYILSILIQLKDEQEYHEHKARKTGS
jgi:cellulose biosynthesis protein BcsQ